MRAVENFGHTKVHSDSTTILECSKGRGKVNENDSGGRASSGRCNSCATGLWVVADSHVSASIWKTRHLRSTDAHLGHVFTVRLSSLCATSSLLSERKGSTKYSCFGGLFRFGNSCN